MKKCLICGRNNRNESLFCSGCGAQEFGEPFGPDPEQPLTSAPDLRKEMPIPPPPVPTPYIAPKREPVTPITWFDVVTILGFVSSIMGLITVWIVFEPLALISSLIGFFKGSRLKGLAAAGIVIAVIAFIIRLFLTLYDGNLISRWVVEGAFR